MNAIVLKEGGSQAPRSVTMPAVAAGIRKDAMQDREVAHSIVLYRCQNAAALQVCGGWLIGWFRIQAVRRALVRMAREAGFSCFGSLIERFSWLPHHGWTFILILGQSAINIHTYPELGTVSIWLV